MERGRRALNPLSVPSERGAATCLGFWNARAAHDGEDAQTGPINSAIGKLLWAIQAWYAEMENEERSEAVQAGANAAPGQPANTSGGQGWYSIGMLL